MNKPRFTIALVATAVLGAFMAPSAASAVDGNVSEETLITTPTTTPPLPTIPTTTLPDNDDKGTHPPVTTVPPPPQTIPGYEDEMTWSDTRLASVEKLQASDLRPGMKVCRYYIYDSELRSEDLLILEVIKYEPVTEGAVLPYYIDEDSYRIMTESTHYDDHDMTTYAYWDLMYSDDMGVTGDGDYARTYYGSCDQPPVDARVVRIIHNLFEDMF